VPAGNNQGQSRLVGQGALPFHQGLALVQQDGVDVSFQVVDGDERQTLREGEGLGEGDAHQQRPCKSRP
jgi:hypothetical protein